jgi:hypothetical protein
MHLDNAALEAFTCICICYVLYAVPVWYTGMHPFDIIIHVFHSHYVNMYRIM